eukprot:6636209-Prymnesium_polylepis.3
MPAIANVASIPGARMSITPSTRLVMHSASCSERSPPWHATRDAEQALSNEIHGPSRPSTYEVLPDATAAVEPVAA